MGFLRTLKWRTAVASGLSWGYRPPGLYIGSRRWRHKPIDTTQKSIFRSQVAHGVKSNATDHHG